MLHTVAASLGLNASWQEQWAWFSATYPGAQHYTAIAGAGAAAVILFFTFRRPVGRFVGIVAALLMLAAGVQPGPVIGAVLSVVDIGLTAAVGLISHF